MRFHSSKRGGLMLGMAGLIMAMMLMSMMISEQSLGTYANATSATHFMQARAAAEGAVVLTIQRGQAPAEPLRIGECTVHFDPPETSAGQMSVRMRVERKRPLLDLVARFSVGDDGRLDLVALEKSL